ncbi:UNVERIFIED_CONTAM: hypothetical protein PYX00_011096 [Menopon gallinae]|uniref:Glutaredoxin n=1 Tax=Menopon gallinae TaxID=328185 RepID=A0AAW2H5U7_9NEOP
MNQSLNENSFENLSKEELEQKVTTLLQEYPTLLFMKGEKDMPACGFSAGVVEILNRLGINYETINILVNPELRAFMKEYSNWPTYPQLYHKGNLIGGYDIIAELYNNNELQEMLK